MAKYVRAESDSPRSWVVAWGVPALILAVGFAMTGFVNFWLGIALMALAVTAMSFDLWFKHQNWELKAKIRSIVALWIGYLVFLWFAFVPAPLQVVIDVPPGNYPPSTNILGIQWRSDYYPVNFIIANDTDNEYGNFDTYVMTSHLIAKVGIRRSINQCIASLDNPNVHTALSMMSYEENGATVSVPLMQEDQQTRSKTYRIRCDKLAPHSRFEILLAATGKPEWIVFQSSFTAAGRGRETFDSKCLAISCPAMPKSKF